MVAKIVVHGGAGFWKRDIKRAVVGVRNSAEAGARILVVDGSALDAVDAAVSAMEDDPIFNAGRGSALTWIGTVEMDAAIMDGRTLSAGAVALVHEIKNPIELARIVMENTDHVLLAGATAEKLAKTFHLPSANPITERRRQMFLTAKKKLNAAGTTAIGKNIELLREHPELEGHDTVGAVAVDTNGNFAAAASTGGTLMKLPGRIGDTPLIGAGLYSDNECGAATVTGWGEIAIKLSLSRTVCMMMGRRVSALRAATSSVSMASKRLNGHAGVIAIDPKGRIAAVHNTQFMPWAYWSTSMKHPRARMRGRIVERLK
jgi:beta-aspartyl-peptidase (threonine type)